MMRKIINLISLVGISLALLFVDTRYPDLSFRKGYITFFAASFSYLLLKLILDDASDSIFNKSNTSMLGSRING